MPLAAGSDRATIGRNIREMIASGHPRDQAIAASLSNARRHPRVSGGAIERGLPDFSEMAPPNSPQRTDPDYERNWERRPVFEPPEDDTIGPVRHAAHRQMGGSAPLTPSTGTVNPMTQSYMQRFSAMSPEQLQEMTVRLGGSPLQSLAQRILTQKRLTGGQQGPPPTQQAPPQAQPQAPPAQPPTQQLQPQQGFARGGFGGMGGGTPSGISMSQAMPPWMRHQQTPSGYLHSFVPGRTDHIATSPKDGSFVVPGDILSGIGQGNGPAGWKIMQHTLSTGPMGIPLPGGGGRGGHRGFAKGGAAKDGPTGAPVPILAAGGEGILTPEQVTMIGAGDHKRGENRLNLWVVHERKRIIEEMKRLKGPVKS